MAGDRDRRPATRSTRVGTSHSTSSQRIGLAFTPPEPEDSLRCHYDAGNYQMAVEAFVWRTYEESLPA